MTEQRTIGTVINLSLEENDAVEELQRLDKDVYSRDVKLPKMVIMKGIFKAGIIAFRKELLNEAE